MSKLETINKSISEIRNILGEECVDIEQLPNLIRNIVNDSSRSGFTTTFLFSNDLNPTLPVGGTFNIETGLVEELEGN